MVGTRGRWLHLCLLIAIACGALIGLVAPTGAVGAASNAPVLIWGDNRSSQLGSAEKKAQRAAPLALAGTAGGVITLAGGSAHTLALRNDGTVVSWGSNFPYGQLGRGSNADQLDPGAIPALAGVTAIALFRNNNLAVSGGNVFRWGYDGLIESRVPVQMAGIGDAKAVGAGAFHSLAVLNDSTVRAWGANGDGQLGDGTGTRRATPVTVVSPDGRGALGGIVAVAGGEAHTLALAADGTVYAWGSNQQGQLGLGTFDTARHTVPVVVPGLSGITAIATGYRFSLALRNDGTLFAFGSNAEGQMGLGVVGVVNGCTCVTSPAVVAGLGGIVGIGAGERHVLAIRQDGRVFGIGDNGSFQLGLTTPAIVPAATEVPGITAATLVAGGGGHSLALEAVITPTFDLTVEAGGPGTVELSPPGGRYPQGTVVTLTPRVTAGSGAIFTGWTVDGQPAGYAVPLSITVDRAHTVRATFVVPPTFCDVSPNDLYYEAIRQLAARGVIRGITQDDGSLCFAPQEGTKRAQMAALIARPLGWDREDHGNGFSDQGSVDGDLWRNVGALAFYDVARGYKAETCATLGVAAPCYGPTDAVLHAQVISFITRGMVAKGYWQPQPEDPALYPNVPADSGHRQDIATYVHYAGALPDTTDVNGAWAGWDQPAPRGWFAEAEWRALNSYFGLDRTP